MKKRILILAMLTLPALSYAQFGGLLKKVKEKASTVVDRKIDKVIDGASKDNAAPSEVTEKSGGEENAAPVNLKADPIVAYSRFDFVAGDKVVYAESFEQDAIGELPMHWTTKGKGEIMKLQQQPGQWLRGYENSTLTSINKNELGDNYTVEFDLIYRFAAKEAVYVMPDITVRLLNNYTVDYKNASGNVSDREGEQSFDFVIHPKEDASEAWIDSYYGAVPFKSDRIMVSNFSRLYNQPVHYAIQVQGKRLRVWLNEQKIFDLPQALNLNKKMARIAFNLGHSSFDDEQVGYYVSNIRMAEGSADTRHKLLETGTFTTSGILFDVGSDRIKPASFGILNELSKILKDNPAVRIRVTGHTSSDGSAATNMELSKKRALAVKDYFSKQSIDAARVETAGLGDSKPLEANTTQIGRMRNRRVEFTKL